MKTPLLKTSLLFLPLALVVPAFSQPAGDTPSNMPQTSPEVTSFDRSFAQDLAEGSTNEVALSELADSRAASPDVKSFAQMMVTDHTKLNSHLTDLVSKRGVDIQDQVMKGEKKGVAGLEKKSGAEFDKAYIKAMVKGHRGAADLLKKEAAEGKDPEFAKFAADALPTVLEHLQRAEALQKSLEN